MSRNRALAASAILIAILVGLAWRNSFIQDDAFITFRYAHNLIEHQDLTWQPGEDPRVEGYTNFLWVLLIAAAMTLGIDPVDASMFLGLAFFAATLAMTYRLAGRFFDNELGRLLAVGLLGMNYSFSAYATGGLETQSQAFFIVAIVDLTLHIGKRDAHVQVRHFLWLSLLAAACMMTRLDSAIPILIAYVFVASVVTRSEYSSRQKVRAAAFGLVPATLLVGTWFAWKLWYYGDILPNTFYAKGSDTSFGLAKHGFLYLHTFLRSYALYPFVLLGLVQIGRMVKMSETRLLIAIALLWVAYIVKVGGDFMEFRLLVPLLPLVFILLVCVIHGVNRDWRIRLSLAAAVVMGSVHHAVTYESVHRIESIPQLQRHLVAPNQSWIAVGRTLGELFANDRDVVLIATGAAGAIPYYSELNTLDIRGLNDKWVAHNAKIGGVRPGHMRLAPMRHMVERGVHILLGQPRIAPAVDELPSSYSFDDIRGYRFVGVTPELLPPSAALVRIPMDDERDLLAIYLTRNDRVDAVFRANGITPVPIVALSNH